jgi:hypothetical protein
MVETQTPWFGDGMHVRRPWERVSSVIVSLLNPRVSFFYLVRIKSEVELELGKDGGESG